MTTRTIIRYKDGRKESKIVDDIFIGGKDEATGHITKHHVVDRIEIFQCNHTSKKIRYDVWEQPNKNLELRISYLQSNTSGKTGKLVWNFRPKMTNICVKRNTDIESKNDMSDIKILNDLMRDLGYKV